MRLIIFCSLFLFHNLTNAQNSIKLINISTGRTKKIQFKDYKNFEVGEINKKKARLENNESIYKISEIMGSRMSVHNDSLMIFSNSRTIKETFKLFSVDHYYNFRDVQLIVMPLDQIDYIKVQKDPFNNFPLAGKCLITLGIFSFIFSPVIIDKNFEKNYKKLWLGNICAIGVGIGLHYVQPKYKTYYFNRKFIRKNNNWTFAGI